MPSIAHQLELKLWQELKTAKTAPVAADLSKLWLLLELSLAEIDFSQQLHVAGEAVAKIVEVYVLRANEILDSLELKDKSLGPILSDDFLNGLMRQSMSVNLSELMETLEDEVLESQESETQESEIPDAVSSIVVPVDKNIALSTAREAKKAALQLAVELAEKERVSEWAEALSEWFELKRGNDAGGNDAVSLYQLQQELEMPLVEVWLALLLKGQEKYSLEQRGDFYDPSGIFISNRLWSCR